ncbi:MAG: TIGR02449 family protein [Gammaproteobacteria bacterium]|nr:TIGR02449 family protein [Gammaproteobacteria bacterium]
MSHEEAYQPLDIKDLELKLDQLIELYQSVKSENDTLKVKQEVLIREKAQLLEKTTLAKNRVEAMISRLKVMGQGS